ncbi:hypothetical protein [Burkholderia sp. LMG 21824]|uniref:hypothetical protein n=1 Tax=Burkholderia sp. LMG 21824 TaxID=3158172 RepID=UPI003C2E46F9
MFTLNHRAQLRIGVALDRREVTSLQRILQCIAPHAPNVHDDSRALTAIPPRSARVGVSTHDTSDRVARHRLPNKDAFLKHFLRLQPA